VDDYEYVELDDESDPPGRGTDRAASPGVPSFQTLASVLLVVVSVTIIWLIFGPQPEPETIPGLPTATSVPGSTNLAGTTVATVERTSAAEGRASTHAAAGGTPATTATPAGLSEGSFARVSGTDAFDLRFRFGPGTEYVTIRIIEEGEVLRVSGGPEEADGSRWWRLQDKLGNIGWAAEQYLAPVASPAVWSPPAASPTFASGTEGSIAPTAVP